MTHPFTPLATRIASLRNDPGLPLVWVGPWYAGGRLTGAEKTGKTAVLTYTSCGSGSHLGSCLETISLSSELVTDPRLIHSTLAGATCRTFTVAGAPGVAWTKDLAGETAAGVYVFTGKAGSPSPTTSRSRRSRSRGSRAVSKLVRPLPPAKRLPPRRLRHALAARCLRRTRSRGVAPPDPPLARRRPACLRPWRRGPLPPARMTRSWFQEKLAVRPG